jgi:dTDP-4-amino-4,6-dideoxygalactose transaminase
MNIPFSPPFIDNTVIDEVVDSLKSGWITTGPKVKALEKEIKKFTKANEVLCVNSWSSGAFMIMKWLGIQEGDEVIIPAYTYSATALAVIHAGGKPVMVDVSEDFNISVASIKKAITKNTKAIIPVDIAGFPCDHKGIMKLVTDSSISALYSPITEVQKKIGRILVINDAAHSFGASYKKEIPIGSETDVTIFSLHAAKNITTAEGGAVCLNLPIPFDNKKLYSFFRQMTLNGQTKDAFTKRKPGHWRYDVINLGMKINMADVNAAIGLAQMRQYPKLLSARKKIFNTYNTAFMKFPWAIVPPSVKEGKESSYHLYALRIKNIDEGQRDAIIDEISKKNVCVNVHFIPLPMLTYFKNQGYDIKNYPQSYKNYSCEISLPLYPQLTEDEVSYVINTVKEAYETVIL